MSDLTWTTKGGKTLITADSPNIKEHLLGLGYTLPKAEKKEVKKVVKKKNTPNYK